MAECTSMLLLMSHYLRTHRHTHQTNCSIWTTKLVVTYLHITDEVEIVENKQTETHQTNCSIWTTKLVGTYLHVANEVQILEILHANERLLGCVNVKVFQRRVSQRLPVTRRHSQTCNVLCFTATHKHRLRFGVVVVSLVARLLHIKPG